MKRVLERWRIRREQQQQAQLVRALRHYAAVSGHNLDDLSDNEVVASVHRARQTIEQCGIPAADVAQSIRNAFNAHQREQQKG